MLSLYCDRSSGCSLQVCPCCGKLMMSTSGLSAPSSAPSGSVGWSGGLSIGSSAQLLVTVSVTNVGTVLVAKGSTTMRSCSVCPAEVDAWVDGPAEVVAGHGRTSTIGVVTAPARICCCSRLMRRVSSSSTRCLSACAIASFRALTFVSYFFKKYNKLVYSTLESWRSPR